MEYALYINETSSLRLWSPHYTRLYFGNEFCDWKTPTLSEIEEILTFVNLHHVALTVVSSYCTDEGLSRFREIIRLIKSEQPRTEVVINDWGVFRLCKELGLGMVFGRLLVRQKRDPRIPYFINSLPRDIRKRFQDTGLNNYLLNFLKAENIKRIELDNVSQGIDLGEVGENHIFSLYLPSVFVSLTRYCIFNMVSFKERFKLSPCKNRKCQEKKIYNNKMRIPIYIHGNAIFYKNYILPKDTSSLRINRIVYMADF